MGIVKRALKSILRLPANALFASSSTVSQQIDAAILTNPAVAAKFYPYQPAEASYVLPPTAASDLPAAPLAVPPPEAWMCFETTRDEYLSSGRQHIDAMRTILFQSGFTFPRGSRILDFGCAAGRMTRWLQQESESCEIWGTDIQARLIAWCQQHLSPPFHFMTTTTFPHLPFEDNYFDLIYSGAVFSQIADLGDAWLLELRRILAPGGKLYITIHDDHSIEAIMNFPEDHRLRVLRDRLVAFDRLSNILTRGFSMFTIARTPLGALVFHDREHLRKTWGRLFDILSVTPEAYLFQTAVLLEKPKRSRR